MLIDRAYAQPGEDELTASDDDAWFSAWRSRELSRVERAGLTYLDYTGSALHAHSIVASDAVRLNAGVFGNPHSESAPSRAATDDIESARAAILDFLHASDDEYVVVLTPNATGACRLVGESFPFGRGSVLALSADNHNSVNGIREFARRAGADINVLALDEELRLRDPVAVRSHTAKGPSLFAFPAQSNFSGVRHPLALISMAQERGWRVLLDAASFLPSTDLRLDRLHPDFVALSIYKIAGYPTGIGALVARREALAELRRPWFAGGTVQWVSVREDRHRLGQGAEAFEDGTPHFLAAGAVRPSLAAVTNAARTRLGRHLMRLTDCALQGLRGIRHSDDSRLVRIHGPQTSTERGATIAITLYDRGGRSIPYWEVEEAARREGIALRGGCFCNPGCAEAAFSFPAGYTADCLDPMGDGFTIPRFATCVGDAPVGAIRISFGLGSIGSDVSRLVEFLARYTTGA